MMRAEQDAKERKARQKEEEARMEADFRQQMMDKFAREDRL